MLTGLVRDLEGAVVPMADGLQPGLPRQVACGRLDMPAQALSSPPHPFLIHGQAVWSVAKSQVKKVARHITALPPSVGRTRPQAAHRRCRPSSNFSRSRMVITPRLADEAAAL